MEITGKLIQILEPQKGNSAKGEWKKQDFIIETDEQYPKKVCIANWNDKVDLTNLKIGTELTLSINLESREFNGKWYTDVKVWRMDGTKSKSSPGIEMEGSAPMDAPPPQMNDMAWDGDDEEVGDLPF